MTTADAEAAMKIAIRKMWKTPKAGERSDVVASFDVDVGDFRIRGCSLRRRHDNGRYFAATPGRGSGDHVIYVSPDSPLRDALCNAMLTHFEAAH